MFEFVFVLIVPRFAFDMFEFAVVVVLVVVVVVVVVVFAFDTVDVLVVVLELRFMLDVLLAPVSPHAMPSAPSARTAESVIIFFILKAFSCLLQRLDLTKLKKHLAPFRARDVPT